ncbi:hypothetical protein WL05_00580 [Burkholderia ubonensis]|nr:hypothetical protein WJ52_28960 [Burkholderia ubonensis]KVM11330.1 hypothetical protein WJ51_17020 [Burkholderia ubonensis]KVM49136.1 hypothetical protein WJ56_18035 [Burkholderia ubonensis]KVX47573.1 hypothetical protein WL05_00580 [Burkholderia ubonensis]KVX94533.1 hypothetical protein WL10_07590 [Burkholderia ubonensis]
MRGIRLAKKTVRKLMTDAGLWVPHRQRSPKVYQPQARHACLGELIQIDGSEHQWFEDGVPQSALLVYVDDATRRLMHLHFTATELTFSLFTLLFEKSRAHDKKRIKTLGGGFIKNKFHSVLAARKISSNL